MKTNQHIQNISTTYPFFKTTHRKRQPYTLQKVNVMKKGEENVPHEKKLKGQNQNQYMMGSQFKKNYKTLLEQLGKSEYGQDIKYEITILFLGVIWNCGYGGETLVLGMKYLRVEVCNFLQIVRQKQKKSVQCGGRELR